MPRKKTLRRQRKRGCHVCSNGTPVAIYKDQYGNHLAACDRTSCSAGYTFQREIHRQGPAS